MGMLEYVASGISVLVVAMISVYLFRLPSPRKERRYKSVDLRELRRHMADKHDDSKVAATR